MKILLVMNLPYEPAFGGASKANRTVLELLAQKGYSVSAVVPSFESSLVSKRNMPFSNSVIEHESAEGVNISEIDGVTVHAVDVSRISLRTYLAKYLCKHGADCVLVSSEDSMQILLREAISYAPSRVVYLAHTPNCLPFGPASFLPSTSGSALFRKIRAVIAVSHFCGDYIRQWSDIRAIQLYLPIYGQPPYPYWGKFRGGFITMVNPCAYKGITIFLQLAQENPALQFAAVPSWGTTANDVLRLKSLSNITLLDAHPNIDTILQRTSLLLVPSLYLENTPMIIMESMLRGIPVIASNVGGIPEIKLGTDYVLDVRPIEQYSKVWDERKLWVPVVPAQDIALWSNSLRTLMTDEEIYVRASEHARDTSAAFVHSLRLDPLEDLLGAMAIDESR